MPRQPLQINQVTRIQAETGDAGILLCVRCIIVTKYLTEVHNNMCSIFASVYFIRRRQYHYESE